MKETFWANHFKEPIVPNGSLVEYHPVIAKGPVKSPSIWKESLTWIVPLIRIVRWRGIWKGDVLVADLEELETMDASEIYSKKTQCERGDKFPKEKGESIFFQSKMDESSSLEEIKTWEHPPWYGSDQLEEKSHFDFLRESEGSLPPPHESFPYASEAIYDFWSMSGNFIYRHHVEPRVKLLLAERRIIPSEVHWRIQNYLYKIWMSNKRNASMIFGMSMGQETFSDPWTGFTQFTLLEEKPPEGCLWCGEEINEKTADIQARSFVATTLENNGK